MTTRLTAATSSRRSVLQSARRLFARGPASRARALAIAIVLSVAVAFVALYPPRPSAILAALSGVSWTWLSIALLVNVASIVFRAEAWRLLMAGSVQGAGPGRLASLSGYSVGLLGNTLLPARAGEAARIVVATRHLPPAPGRSSAVAGSVLAQRFLDVVIFAVLVVVVLASGHAPAWVLTGTLAVAGAGLGVVAVAAVVGRRAASSGRRGRGGPLRWLLAATREGLAVLRDRRLVARAACLQACGWIAQLMVVDLTLRAFSAPVPLVGSALVLVLLNGILAFPLWPGGIGAYQAVVALALVPYGVDYATGLSLGLGLQAVESLVGIGFGLAFLAHEGLSLATLRRGAGVPG